MAEENVGKISTSNLSEVERKMIATFRNLQESTKVLSEVRASILDINNNMLVNASYTPEGKTVEKTVIALNVQKICEWLNNTAGAKADGIMFVKVGWKNGGRMTVVGLTDEERAQLPKES